MNYIKNIKLFLILGLAIAVVWFYKDYHHQKNENKRQSANMSSMRKNDSLHFTSQTYTKREFEEYLAYMRKDLAVFLRKNKISTRRIEQLITQTLSYKDTSINKVDLNPLLNAIKQRRNTKIAVVDSTKCMIIRGWVVYKNDTLSLDITDRQFSNQTDVIKYWERRQWKFLGIKTRLFGKKTATVIIKDACGTTKTITVDVKK